MASFKEVEPHLRDIASRMDEAEDNFLDQLQHFGGITRAEARKVFNLYRKMKLLKRDLVAGRYTVKHGGYLDREVIRRALTGDY